MMSSESKTAKDNFSVALGLTDYGNPICYAITSSVILMNLNRIMQAPDSWIYILGVAVSLIFGFTIPTVKLLVGLGKMKFALPTNLVFYVNAGLFASGLMLLKNILSLSWPAVLAIAAVSIIFLYLMYKKMGKFNPIAILTGAVGYLFIYIAFITLGLQAGRPMAVVFFGIAVILYLSLIGIGMKADLMDARVHWVLELTNIGCQASVAIGTIFLFM